MPQDYDTTNHFVISVTGDGVLISHVLRRAFTPDMALNLAAYLLILSGAERSEFDALVRAIEST